MARKSRRKVLDTETMTYLEMPKAEEYTNKTAIYARLSREDNGVENGSIIVNFLDGTEIEFIND